MSGRVLTESFNGFTLRLPNKPILAIMAAIAVLVLINVAMKSQFMTQGLLHINSMQVFGDLKQVTQEQLQEAVKPYLNTNFFNADLSGIKQAVEALPWVASASVRRVWPDQMYLIVKEHRAVARWDERYLINEQGQLFQPAAAGRTTSALQDAAIHDNSSGLVRLRGPDNSYQQLFAQYSELQPLFAQYGLKISNVSVNDRRALSLELSNGIRINFGRINAASDIYSMVTRFLDGYEKELKEHMAQIETVDLRYTNGFAVQWKTSNNSNQSDKQHETVTTAG